MFTHKTIVLFWFIIGGVILLAIWGKSYFVVTSSGWIRKHPISTSSSAMTHNNNSFLPLESSAAQYRNNSGVNRLSATKMPEPNLALPVVTTQPINKLPEQVQALTDPKEFYTPEHLDRLVKSTPIETALSIASRLPEGTVQDILDKIPEDYLREKLSETNLALSPEELRQEKPSVLLARLVKAVGEKGKTTKGTIFFCSVVNSDNSPSHSRNYFSPAERKIYACFRNDGALNGLDKIVVFWTNTTTGKIMYWGTLPINPHSVWNYVYLENKVNWSAGTYTVSLFKTVKDEESIMQDNFEIN